MTHDYTRNGVTTWFAALTRLTGPVRSMTEGRASGLPLHRHQAWRRFLKMIDRQTPKYKERHLIGDDYATGRPRATHPHPEVKAWLAKHLRFHRHFPPPLFLAQPGRALLSRHHTPAHPPRRVQLRGGVARRHQRLHRRAQCQAVHLNR